MGKVATFCEISIRTRLIVPFCFWLLQVGDKDVIRLGHGLDVNHPVHKAMEFMAERVREKSDGELTIQIYPSQQLGTERELLELVQIGSVDMTKVSGAVLENFVPEIRVLSLPYLFRDDRHLWNVLWGEIGKEMLMQGEKPCCAASPIMMPEKEASTPRIVPSGSRPIWGD